MTTLSAAQITDLAARLSATAEDEALFISEGQFEGFDHSDTQDRSMGHSDWVGYLPSCQRASWVCNGDPVWFDASSLADAVDQVVSGAELSN